MLRVSSRRGCPRSCPRSPHRFIYPVEFSGRRATSRANAQGVKSEGVSTLLPTLPSPIYISGRVFRKEGDKQGQCSGCQAGWVPTLLPTLPSPIYISGRVFHKEGVTDKVRVPGGCVTDKVRVPGGCVTDKVRVPAGA